jgi:hypothetical protein
MSTSGQSVSNSSANTSPSRPCLEEHADDHDAALT